jgi:hypothetical protein
MVRKIMVRKSIFFKAQPYGKGYFKVAFPQPALGAIFITGVKNQKMRKNVQF